MKVQVFCVANLQVFRVVNKQVSCAVVLQV